MAKSKNSNGGKRSWIYLVAALYCFVLGTLSYASFSSSASIAIGAALYIAFLILITFVIYLNRDMLR